MKRKGVTHPPYSQEFREAAIGMVRSGRDPGEVGRELGVRRETLRTWLHRADISDLDRGHTREEVIERTIREFVILDRLVAGLSHEDHEVPLLFGPEALDRWTVKDALVHITYWKADVARIARRQRRPPEVRRAMGDDPNHFVYLSWRDRPPQEVVAWHRQVHEDVLAALRAAPETWFSSKKARTWWPPNIDHHPAQHRRDIEKALAEATRR